MVGSLESQDNHPADRHKAAERAAERAESGLTPAGTGEGNSWADVARREIQLLGAGISGFGQAATDSVNSVNLAWTVGKVALATGAAFAFGRLKPVTAIGQELLRSAGMSASLGFGMDVATNGYEVGSAMIDAGSAKPNWDQDVATMKHSLGGFAFDTALMAPAAFVGGRLGMRASGDSAAEMRSFAAARTDEPSVEAQAIRKYVRLMADGHTPPPLMALVPELNRSIYGVIESSSRVTDYRQYDRILDQLRGSLNEVHRANALPDIVSLRDGNIGDLGNHVFGNIKVNSQLFRKVFEYPNPSTISQDQARLASLIIHEDQHLADEALIAQRLADKLGIGRDPSHAELKAIFGLHPHGDESDWWRHPEFIKEALSRRPQDRLSPADTARADLLLDSLRLPVAKRQIETEIKDAREFQLELPHHHNDYETFYRTARDTNDKFIPGGMRNDIDRLVAAVRNGQLTETEAGEKIYLAGERNLQALEQRLAQTPKYAEWPHESFAFAVERQSYEQFLQAHGKQTGFGPRSWLGAEDAVGIQPVRRFLSG